jgi:heme A synthase
MTRRRWILVLVLVVCDAVLAGWTVHLQLTWHPVPRGPRVMPAVQLVRWALSVGLLAAVGFVFFDARDTARNGHRER